MTFRLAGSPEFQIQLLAFVELGWPFVKATYFLEGDGFLCVYAFDKIHGLLNMRGNFVHPRADAIIDQQANTRFSNAAIDVAPKAAFKAALRNDIEQSFLPAINYLEALVNNVRAIMQILFD